MKQETRKRIGIISSSLIVSLSMMLSIIPQGIKATEEETPVQANPYVEQPVDHEHDENCGYVEAKPEVPCNHIYDETCGEADDEGNTPNCQHIHEDCSYQAVIEGQPCNFEENKISSIEDSVHLVQVNDVVAEEVEITFDDDTENAMTTAIAKAMEGKDKNTITTIKVTGNAGTITDKNWTALLSLYTEDSEYKSLKALDLSAMINLTTIASYSGKTISPTQLTTVNLPNTLTEIGDFTFSNCENLNISQLPSKLEIIGISAFNGCSSLSLTELPDTITSIGGNAFGYCTKLALTKLPSQLTQIEGSTYISCKNLNIKTLPEGIEYIGENAFSGSGITEIMIPSKVALIRNEAFRGCSNLNKITFEGSDLPTIGENALDRLPTNGAIYYPEGAKGYEWIATMLPGWTLIEVKKPTPSGSSSSHSHYYGKQWKTDEINHWHECSCGKQKDVEAHEFSEWVEIDEEHRERECLICGYIQKETFAHRQLTDAVTGVQLSGTMSERAELVVSESPTHAAGLCNACDEIRSLMSEGKLIKAYEISLKGEYKGELTLIFPMDPKYNGESFMLYHYVEDGRADQQISVSNGKAEGKVQTLSPFAIVRSNETITQQVSLNQGEQITIYPATMDGVWAYDDEMIQLTQNKDSYTITAIKEGSTSAVYTTKSTQTIVDVNIPASHVPNTNDSIRGYMLIAIVSLCGLVLIKMNQRKIN